MGGGGGYGPPPMGMPPPPPPQKSGSNLPLIIVGIIAGVFVLGGGSCAVCVCMANKSTTTSSSSPPTKPGTPTKSTTEHWITSDKPWVKFLQPPGWNKDIRGDWGVFKSPDRQAVFAFTTFNRPGESTVRLGAAAGVLGVGEVDWKNPTSGTVGVGRFPARMAEGSCNFGGPGGYIWYATVDAGTSDQILLIYTVSSRGNRSHKDAALTAINSLQKR